VLRLAEQYLKSCAEARAQQGDLIGAKRRSEYDIKEYSRLRVTPTTSSTEINATVLKERQTEFVNLDTNYDLKRK
jgi:hypothetical protein